jgi:hypothetical protein
MKSSRPANEVDCRFFSMDFRVDREKSPSPKRLATNARASSTRRSGEGT